MRIAVVHPRPLDAPDDDTRLLAHGVKLLAPLGVTLSDADDADALLVTYWWQVRDRGDELRARHPRARLVALALGGYQRAVRLAAAACDLQALRGAVARRPADIAALGSADLVLTERGDDAAWLEADLREAGHTVPARHLPHDDDGGALHAALCVPLPQGGNALPQPVQALRLLCAAIDWNERYCTPPLALDRVRRALALDPTLAAAWLIAAELWLAHGEPGEAVAAVARAAVLAPATVGVLALQAELALRGGRGEEALALASQALALCAHYPAALRLQAQATFLLGRGDESLQLLRAALIIHPRDFYLLRAAVTTARRLGDHDVVAEFLPQAALRAKETGRHMGSF